MKRSRPAWIVVALLLALSACDPTDPPDTSEDELGQVMISLTEVPTGVRCLRIGASGARSVTRTFNVTPGMSSVFQINGLPTGTVSFLGEAFAERCQALTAASVASWLSDPVSTTLTSGMLAQVTLVMHVNGRANVGVDFQGEPLCRAANQPCMSDGECCAGLTCAATPDGSRTCQVPAQTLLFALLAQDLSSSSLLPTSIEIVDLDTRTRVRTLDLGTRTSGAIAVTPDGARIYVADSNRNQVSVIDSTSGATLTNISMSFPRDLVISPDGARLYATAGNSFVAVNTATNTITSQLPTGSDTTLGIAISADGSRIGASVQGGSNPAFILVNTSDPLAQVVRIPIGDPVPSCTEFPSDAVFTNTGRVLLWDSGCDAIYQIDLASNTLLASGTITLPRDSGSIFNFNNALTYSAPGARAYVVKDSSEIVVANPATPGATLIGGFTGVPFVITQTPDGTAEYVSEVRRFGAPGGGGDRLVRIDTATQQVTRDLYTFSDATKSVRDMRIVAISP